MVHSVEDVLLLTRINSFLENYDPDDRFLQMRLLLLLHQRAFAIFDHSLHLIRINYRLSYALLINAPLRLAHLTHTLFEKRACSLNLVARRFLRTSLE